MGLRRLLRGGVLFAAARKTSETGFRVLTPFLPTAHNAFHSVWSEKNFPGKQAPEPRQSPLSQTPASCAKESVRIFHDGEGVGDAEDIGLPGARFIDDVDLFLSLVVGLVSQSQRCGMVLREERGLGKPG